MKGNMSLDPRRNASWSSYLTRCRRIPSGIVYITEFVFQLLSLLAYPRQLKHSAKCEYMLFETIMAFSYKTKEIMSHRKRRPKEKQRSITCYKECFSQNRPNVTVLRSLIKYVSIFFRVHLSLRDWNSLIIKIERIILRLKNIFWESTVFLKRFEKGI